MQYGNASNSSRPGRILMIVPFTCSSGNTTLRIVPDNSTATALAFIIGNNCSSLTIEGIAPVASSSNSSDNNPSPLPEQTIQYYRASSIVLTLDGYNDTDASQADPASHVPIPSWVNQTMLKCVNETIDAGAPLINASTLSASFSFEMCLVCLIWSCSLDLLKCSLVYTSCIGICFLRSTLLLLIEK